MCGIAGAFGGISRADSESTAKSIIRQIRYRGPDGDGTTFFDDGFFIHLRLSIIDVTSGGAQPKWSPDGRFCITYNGEIYNYRELRDELIALGQTFNTASDTEVLLKSWQVWGAAGLDRCIGMFAFAIYDAETRELHLARDPYGIKPLYIADTSRGLRFGSTYAALSCFPDCPRVADAARAFEFVRYGYLSKDDSTLVAGVRSLSAGAVETWDLSRERPALKNRHRLRTPRYVVAASPPSFEQAAEELRHAFLQSVRLHLRSDVPIGFALSGGIDSSAIVCAARLLEPDADLHAFTYAPEGGAIDESKWANLVTTHTAAVPHIVRLQGWSAVADLEDIVQTHGAPTGGMSTQAQSAVFEAAHQAGIKVMLDGQGADEAFAGYTGSHIGAALAGHVRHGHYLKALQLFRSALMVPRMGALTVGGPAIEALLPSALTRLGRRSVGREHLPDWIDRRWVERSHGCPIGHLGQATNKFDRDTLASRLEADLTSTILPDLLVYEDRNSMRWSVESRVPFLAALVTDVAFSVPTSYHIGQDGRTKALLRAALKGILPEAIRNRPDKVGFEVPQADWLHAEHSRIDSMLRSDTARAIRLFDYPKLIARWDAINSSQHPDFKFVWRWMGLISWTEAFGISWP